MLWLILLIKGAGEIKKNVIPTLKSIMHLIFYTQLKWPITIFLIKNSRSCARAVEEALLSPGRKIFEDFRNNSILLW